MTYGSAMADEQESYLAPQWRTEFDQLGEILVEQYVVSAKLYGARGLAALEWLEEKRAAREQAGVDHRRTQTKRFWIIAMLAGLGLVVSAISAIGVLVSWLA